MTDDAATVEQLRAELRQAREETELRDRALAEALEQQTATADILRAIAGAPLDLQQVLDAIAESAARLCTADSALIWRVRQASMEAVSQRQISGRSLDLSFAPSLPIDRGFVAGCAVVDGSIVHVPDLLDAPEFPTGRALAERVGHRTTLAAPLLHQGIAIGAVVIGRAQVRPFTEREISLLATFADQAVIAIENARLFEELARRNADLQESNRQVTEALEQQTVTSDILRVIASSPTDLPRVLGAVVQSALRLSGGTSSTLTLREGKVHRVKVLEGVNPGRNFVGEVWSVDVHTPGGHAILSRRTIHIPDRSAPSVKAEYTSMTAWPPIASLAVPLIREQEAIGVLYVSRDRAVAYSDREIALVETFADQAVIAIENARLFEELGQSNAELQESNQRVTRALDQQTALADVLRAIASTPTDLQTVLEAIVEVAVRICEAPSGVILQLRERDGLLAIRAMTEQGRQAMAARGIRNPFEEIPGLPATRESAAGRAMLEARSIHVHDMLEAVKTEYPGAREAVAVAGYRTNLNVPLLGRDGPIGAFGLVRFEVRPFTEQQIGMLETFADQAVIAIENARLFEEIQDRVGELQALGEVSQAVSSTLDLQEVLATIVANAVRLSGAGGGVIYEYDDAAGALQVRATTTLDPDVEAALRSDPPRIGVGLTGRAAAVGGPVQREDLLDGEIVPTAVGRLLMERGYRSLLSVPILRDDQVLGAVTVGRTVPGAFPSEVVALLQTFATQSALAIDNARLYRALEEASRHKSAFLANMSHELRTPLNAVIGYSEMLQEELEDLGQADLVPDVERINTAGRHLLDLINDILDLSKIEAGKMELFLEPVDVDRLVREVATTVGPLVEKNGNVLEVDAAPDLGEMQADATKLRQILFNLLGNAAKFTDHGTISLSATREAGAAGDWLTFAVSDTGIGMTEEQLGRLFQAFTQADASTNRRFGGTGLGLALVHHFCEMLGGGVAVTSTSGTGSTFTVRLPAEVSTPESRLPTDERGSVSPRAAAETGADLPVVLVVDDDAVARDLLRRHLEAEGVRVVTAGGGQEGLRLARELRPALITLDVLMPGLDGWAVLGALKGDAATADIPVIMLTILDDRNLGYALGAADYLTKPIHRDQLAAALRTHIRVGGTRRALVIEDDPATRELLRRTLQREGWTVDEAANGRVGLDRVTASRPDLILLDLLMAELDGFGFLERLRAEPAWRAIPVLVVTAKELTPDERQMLSGSVEQIIQKGAYSRDALLAEVRELVRASVDQTR